MSRLAVPIRVLPHGQDLPLPRWQTAGAAGADLHAAVEDRVQIDPGARALIPTGIAVALPDGWEAQVRPRSGLAVRHGLTVLNAPGTIDADYRGEIAVPLVNLGQATVTIERGDRIAQLVFAPVVRVAWTVVDQLPDDTGRGGSGFGSTG